MAEPKIDTAAEAAEKAYAAAAAAKLEAAHDAPLAFPARAQPVDAPPAAKPVETVTAPMAPVETVVVEVASAPLKAEAAKPLSKSAPVKSIKPKAAKPVPAKIAKPAAPVLKKAASAKKAATGKKAPAVKAAKPIKPKIQTSPKPTPILLSKEKIMATKKKTTDFTADIKSAVADVQVKAKEVLAKGNFVLGEATRFAKGNVEAIVESGKILAAGLQGLGKGYVAEGKAAVETVTADVKEMATIKSPTDFVQLQSKIARRNLDQAFAFGAKNSEAVFKLFNDTFAPLSKRASLAVETIKKAA